MTQQKNKYAEAYKWQRTFPKEVGKPSNVAAHDDKSASAIHEKWQKACTAALNDINFHERLELINLREENQRLLKEIEILMQAILIMGSKVEK